MGQVRKSARSSTICWAEATSRLEKGSSRRRSSGSVWRTRAREARWRMPWEYWPTGRERCGVEADGAEGHLGGGGAGAGAAAVALEGGEVAEVFDGGELVVEHGVVAHVGDAAALVLGLVAEDVDGAAGGGDEAGEDAQEGGFAGAVVAEDDGGGAGGEVGGDFAEGGEGAVELGDFEEGGGGDLRVAASAGLRATLCERIHLDGVSMAVVVGAAWPGLAGAYLEAHLAWSWVAWKTPSRP